MSASSNSTEHRGHALINKLERIATVQTNRLNHQEFTQSRGDIQAVRDTIQYAVHRLRFLEMAVTGLTYKELREAKEYAQFVEDLRQRDERRYQEMRWGAPDE